MFGRSYHYDSKKLTISFLFFFRLSPYILAENEYIIDGSVSIRDVNRELGWDLPETEATTIAGFVINEMKRIPNQGEFIIIDNLKIVVKKKTQNRIKSLSILVHPDKDENSD